MARSATSVAVFWALLAVPALCLGGYVAHACVCGTTAECGRENACTDDPCGVLIARENPQDRDIDIAVAAPAAESDLSVVVPDCFAAQGRRWISPLPLRANLPYHGSDTPLLN